MTSSLAATVRRVRWRLTAGGILTIVVGEREDLASIVLDIYGFANHALYNAILQHNPQLRDLDAIKAGEQLVLPAFPEPVQIPERR